MFKTKNDVSVNVLAVEDRDIYIRRKGRRPSQVESNHKSEKEINLLLISEDGRWHYTVIKHLSRLLASKNSKHHGKQHFCMNCFQGFTFESSRDKHYEYCKTNEAV